MALLLVGIVLLMPPVVGASLIDGRIGGIPVPLLYVFAVWALLITVARLLARGLNEGGEMDSSDKSGRPDI